ARPPSWVSTGFDGSRTLPGLSAYQARMAPALRRDDLPVARSVPHGYERQPVWRGGRAGQGTIAAREDVRQRLRRALPEPDLHERPDDVPDHVLQERRRLDAVDEQRL